MSAETLRKAASLMRERAGAVTARLTKCERPSECSAGGFCGSPQLADMWPENAEHIASWHPAVALAVADWLDREASEHGHYVSQAIRNNGVRLAYANDRAQHALAVACAYLGESA